MEPLEGVLQRDQLSPQLGLRPIVSLEDGADFLRGAVRAEPERIEPEEEPLAGIIGERVRAELRQRHQADEVEEGLPPRSVRDRAEEVGELGDGAHPRRFASEIASSKSSTFRMMKPRSSHRWLPPPTKPSISTRIRSTSTAI